jgi:hypothetical protein
MVGKEKRKDYQRKKNKTEMYARVGVYVADFMKPSARIK